MQQYYPHRQAQTNTPASAHTDTHMYIHTSTQMLTCKLLFKKISREERLPIHTPTHTNTTPPTQRQSVKSVQKAVSKKHPKVTNPQQHQYIPATYNNMNALLAARTRVSNSRHGRESTVSSKTQLPVYPSNRSKNVTHEELIPPKYTTLKTITTTCCKIPYTILQLLNQTHTWS